MPFSIKSNAFGKWLFLIGIFLLICAPAQAQYGKKKKYKKKKSDANIIARGYHDVTTRNNYYFNARLLYLEMLADIELEYQRDYNEILPLYYHQKVEDFAEFEGSLETIIQKTSTVMHMHDNTRWKDNVYLLLGQARYLNGEYYDALKTFQFVVTTMKSDVGKTRGPVDNKAKLKAKKAKEAAKRAKERQKEIDAKKKAMKEALSKLKRDKEKQMASKSKDKKKSIQKKIKAKNKIIALRKKGKKVPQKLLDVAYGKDDETEELVDQEAEKEQQEEEKKEDEFITYKTDYRSERKKQKQEEIARQNELAELNDTIPMTEKEVEKFDDLNLWDKIKHKSSRPDALVWMAKSYMEIGDMLSAQSMLEYAEALPKLTRKQKEGIYAGQAYYYIENRRFENALDALANAADITKKKKKSFYHYISAQLRERQKNNLGAIEMYREIVEGKANYKMKFYANMRMADLLMENGMSSNEEVLELLAKLLKNGSFKEFRDEIHYRVAGIYAAEGDMEKTIEHLQASITNSKSNTVQKSLSFRELGEVYLIQENYNAAAIFYDSAVAVMPQEHETYKDLEFRARTISKVADQAQIIFQTDSLLLLSTMTEQDLEVYLAELEARKKVEDRKRRRKGSSVTSFIEDAVTVQTGSNFASADWYFYNPNLRSQGLTQFKLIWGDRPHEENWRRLEKEAVFDISEIDEVDKTEEDKVVELGELEVYLPIPSTQEEIDAAHKKLSEAYYEIGKLFRVNLELNPNARKAFEQLVLDYKDFPQIDRVYYYLYLIYTDEGNLAKAEHFRNILLKEYPVSQYAYAINHPYSSKSDEEYRPDPSQIEKLYASTYDMFVEGKYTDVIRSRNDAYTTYKENPLMPKFDFLEALSYGHLDSLAELKTKLSRIVTKYPNHEIQAKAREYLAIINKKENEEGFEDTVVVASETDTTAFVSIYSNEESNNIFGMLLLANKDLDVRQMIQILDQYNGLNFAQRKLRVSNAYLDKETPLILIKRFREQAEAEEYLDALGKELPDLFRNDIDDLNLMMITNDNFRTLFTTKKLDEYQTFFDHTYNKP